MKETWAEVCASIMHAGGKGSEEAPKRRLIIDCDAGTDDAEAIMMCLNAPNIEVIGITCVNGNTGVDQVVTNVRRILAVCKRQDVPVFAGAHSPLLAPVRDAHFFHGSDGLGECTDADVPESEWAQPSEEHAINALIRLCKEGLVPADHDLSHGETMLAKQEHLQDEAAKQLLKAKELAGLEQYTEAAIVEKDARALQARATSYARALKHASDNVCPTVEILALGPLTNIALASRMSVEFPATVKRLFVMGGTSDAHGNVPYHATAEFNAFADPEAVAITLTSFHHPVIVTWEACLRHAFTFEDTETWRHRDTSKGRFLKAIQAFPKKRGEGRETGWVPADPLCAAVCLRPDIVTKTGGHLHYVSAELHGSESYAQTVVDHDGKRGCVPNTWVVDDVENSELLALFNLMTNE